MPRYVVALFVLNLSTYAAQSERTGPDAQVANLSASGTGCPQEFSTATLDAAGRLDLTFDVNYAEVAPGLPVENARRDCDVAVTLGNMHGWQVAVRRYELFGKARIDAGLDGVARLWHRNDVRAPLKAAAEFSGLVSRDYHLTTDMPVRDLVWSDCRTDEPVLKLGTMITLTPTPAWAPAVADPEGFLGQCGCGNPDVRLVLEFRRCAL